MLTLGTVIMRLSDKKNNAPIPYRDSKLTRLLQPALEGDSKVSIVCNISPCNDAYDETLSTLKFAQRAKKIKQVIVKNDTTDSKALIVKYEREIYELQERLREMENKMVQEEKSAMNLNVSKELQILQEEKEIADTKLENLLQEKLQLAQDLERLKSFIIHAEDVKPSKLLKETEQKNKKEVAKKNNLMHSKTSSSKEFVAESHESSLLSKNMDLMGSQNSALEDMGNEEINNEDINNEEINTFERHETMLLSGIDNIEFELLGFESPKNAIAKTKIKQALPFISNSALTLEECLKIIEEQRRTIEGQKNTIDVLESEIEVRDQTIMKFCKDIEEKQEQVELLNDELKLCKNNLTKLQIANRFRKVSKN